MGRRRWIILPYIEGHIGPFREIYLSSIRGTNYEIKELNKVLNIYLKDNLLNHCRMFKGAIVFGFFFYLRSMCSEIYTHILRKVWRYKVVIRTDNKVVKKDKTTSTDLQNGSQKTKDWEHRSRQTKDYNIGICCFSVKNAALRRKRKDRMAQNQDSDSSGVTCLYADVCFSVLIL
jgi:hypothetical protein